jgi:hypothetical protein
VAGITEGCRATRRPSPVSRSWGSNPMRDRSFRDARQAQQSVAPTHDRGHDGAPLQGKGSEGLRPARQEVRSLPRPFAGHRDERGSSPLSIAYGDAADRRSDHQLSHRRAAVLLQRNARTARPRPPSDDGAQTAQGPGRAEPGGGGSAARSGARPEVQGRVWRRLRRGAARIRGRRPEGVRHRQQAHDAGTCPLMARKPSPSAELTLRPHGAATDQPR